ncbi:MAG: hypothetical protein KKD18_00705 [Nanoarchaeota archaeon]|nr:hypothetical protein [Nanoarchaeota archaeon]MBU0976917.1 hypothetical protein [Nanoarchaeota archaeon]
MADVTDHVPRRMYVLVWSAVAQNHRSIAVGVVVATIVQTRRRTLIIVVNAAMYVLRIKMFVSREFVSVFLVMLFVMDSVQGFNMIQIIAVHAVAHVTQDQEIPAFMDSVWGAHPLKKISSLMNAFKVKFYLSKVKIILPRDLLLTNCCSEQFSP